MATLLITGGAGFIGSNLVRYALAHTPDRVVVVDKLTYAGNLVNLDGVLNGPRTMFVQADIADTVAMARVFREVRPSAVLNLAAETDVDRSIDSPYPFVDTNVVGTFRLLETARQYAADLRPAEREQFRFVHASTDEVHGTLDGEGLIDEETAYAPSSPHAASKAAADHFVRAYVHTYGLAAVITTSSNNYGPRQFPEKLVPSMILNAADGRHLTVDGDAGHVRDWLHVEDHCAGLLLALAKGRPGEKYNIGGGAERTNLQVIDALLDAVEDALPAASNPALAGRGIRSYRKLKTFVKDRSDHDRRYAIDAAKARRDLGWAPRHTFERGIDDTVRWYLGNRAWCAAIDGGSGRVAPVASPASI